MKMVQNVVSIIESHGVGDTLDGVEAQTIVTKNVINYFVVLPSKRF